MKIRSFVAIEIPSSIQDALIKQTSNLRKLYPNPVIRWVKPGNIHFTLKFLGDLSQKDLEKLARSLYFEASRIYPFMISFSEMGIFPNTKNPRIIWAGVKTPAQIIEFQNKIQALSSGFGIPMEKRPFSPHITVGRIGKSDLMLNVENLIMDLRSTIISKIDSVSISTIKIFKSDLMPDGPIYTAIHNIPFKQ